jgi:hypothetical protein
MYDDGSGIPFAIVGVTVTDGDDGGGGHIDRRGGYTDRRGGDDDPGSRDEHAGSRNNYPRNREANPDVYELGLGGKCGTG